MNQQNAIANRIGKLWSDRFRLDRLWRDEEGQDVAEYAMMMAVILVIVLSTAQLIASNAGQIFSSVGSAIQ
jgi:Flp pilus assembly pilin Flp